MIRIVYQPSVKFLDQPSEDIEIESERDWDLAYVHRLVDRINALIESQRS